jgi:hypothetical protein
VGSGLAYHAASMRPRTLLVVLAVTALTTGVACTGDSSTETASTSTSASPLPTTDVNATIVPGEWTYEYLGVKATFEWKDGPPILTVKNDSGSQVGAPAVYVVTQDQRHVEGKLGGSGPLADGADGQYTVTFPADLTREDVGLVVLQLGDVNWGALSPKVIEK